MSQPVVFVLIDGLRPEAVQHGEALQALIGRSAYTLAARSVMPSMTLPCHMSIFHSVPPERHGITQNTWQPMARPVTGLFDRAYLKGRKCAFIYNWEPLRDVSRPEHLHYSLFINNTAHPDGDLEIAREAVRYISGHQPDFIFVYFGAVDMMGHLAGWMSEPYIEGVRRADHALGTLLDGISEEYAVVLQSDHGGHDRIHGTDLPEDMTIPWLVSGRGLRENHELTGPVSLLDTAPTIAHLLGIGADPAWEGRVVEEAFTR